MNMKIAFASCCKLQKVNPQPVWADIRAEQPDVLLLLGDNIYLDNDRHTVAKELEAELASLYAAQLAEPNFAALLADMKARGKPVLATYDDHDFLGNDRLGSDAPVALRNVARDQLIAAFNPRRTGADVYSSQVHGNVRIVVLDTRYYRDSVVASAHDRDAILGATQWQWFEAELRRKDTPYLLVASSTTFHRYGISSEAWEYYPAAFWRLRDLLRHRSGALVVSGDIHNNDLYDDSGVVEVVSSGVARPGLLHGGLRRNYGLFSFGDGGLDVDLRSNRPRDRLQAHLPLGAWHLQ